MNCLECGKEGKGKYCSKRCGNLFRVKRHRKVAVAKPEVVEEGSKGGIRGFVKI